jgi:four helix bundle protein
LKLKIKNEEGQSFAPDKAPRRDIVDRTFRFAVRVVQLCKHLDERPGVARVMMSQILRSGTSVPANIEEAQAAQSRADFVSKMSIALKEARETHLRLRLLREAKLVAEARLQPLIAEADELAKILAAIVVSTRRNGNV